ncbi:unnamed protein product [Polarella glacialis]|uniref:Uncharacterized protein n=1 Tax=Polarella glacialis TaxID=89957 RepID=A0A813L652_POLGL|nr:unnamed protein product [Polarella glacialis]
MTSSRLPVCKGQGSADQYTSHKLVSSLSLTCLASRHVWELLGVAGQLRALAYLKAELHDLVAALPEVPRDRSGEAGAEHVQRTLEGVLRAMPALGAPEVLVATKPRLEYCHSHKQPWVECVCTGDYDVGRLRATRCPSSPSSVGPKACSLLSGERLLLARDNPATNLPVLPPELGAQALSFVLSLPLVPVVSAVCGALRRWVQQRAAWQGLHVVLRTAHLHAKGSSGAWCDAFGLIPFWGGLQSISLDVESAPGSLQAVARQLVARHCAGVQQLLCFSSCYAGESILLSVDGLRAVSEQSWDSVVFTSGPLPSLSWGRYFAVSVLGSWERGGGGLCVGLCSATGRLSGAPRSVLQTRGNGMLALALANGSWWWSGRKSEHSVPCEDLAPCLEPGGPSVGLWLPGGHDVVVCIAGVARARNSGLLRCLAGDDGDLPVELYGLCDLVGRTTAVRLEQAPGGAPGGE